MKTLLSFLLLFVAAGCAAQLTLPDESPYVQTTHRIGITDVTVTYHSPGVKGRKIWGGLVPYGQVWRAGANENTTIAFAHDVTVNGKPLQAGTYGLHMLPAENEWIVIFSKNHTSWGSFSYKESEDALRVSATPASHDFTEWMEYSFGEKKDNGATLSLVWEKIAVPVTIEADVKNIVLANIRNELRSTPGFSWVGWWQAAEFCYANKTNYDEALQWIGVAEEAEPKKFSILRLKANLLYARGDSAKGNEAMKAAKDNATETELNNYGYALLAQGKLKDVLEIFKTNVKKFPKSWNAHDSYGEALAMNGEKSAAIKEYEEALKQNPPEDQKERIDGVLKELKGK